MLSEYQPLADALKAKALAGQKKYYYVFFVGTRPSERKNGLCSAIMRKYQEIASRDQLPIFLEATTEASMKLYLKLGWEVIDEILLGKGKAGSDGVQCKNGEGLKIWGMVWRPEKA
jgi:Acetyltransferase (GNAT) family